MNVQRTDRTSSHRVGALAAAFATFTLLLVGLSTASALAACPNEAIREAQGAEVMALPDCMALEMVSPPQKGGQPAKNPAISADGERVIFFSTAALGGTSGVREFIIGDPYVASRGESGWATAATTPPIEMAKGWGEVPGAESFSPDFSSWLVLGATLPQYGQGIARLFQGGLGGQLSPLSPLFAPLGGGEPNDVSQSAFQGASADHSHLYFLPGKQASAYLPGDPEPAGTGATSNTYLAQLDAGGEPSLQLLARDSSAKAWGGNCGATLGGLGVAGGNQGAISPDGDRTYFSARASQSPTGACNSTNKLRILVRTETEAGPQIAPLFSSQCARVSPPCDTSDADDLYQGASVDQTKVYFASARQLADTDLDTTSDLYLFDSTKPLGQRLIQVSAGGTGDPSPGSGANVSSAAAISGDGSHVYFTSSAVLTTAQNPEGAEAQAGKPNLYLYEPEDPGNPGHPKTAFIGTVEGGVSGGYPVPIGGQDPGGVEVGGDGHVLLFESKAPLTPAEDADGAHRDVYRYDAETPQLRCVSCRPGAADNEPVDVDAQGSLGSHLGTDFAEEQRWVSEDGEAAVFTTKEALLPAAENGVTDSYLWRQGQLYLLPGTSDTSGKLADVPVLSRDGSEVGFHSFAQLLPQDGDSAIDTYVIRAQGGYPQPAPPVACKGEGCQEPFQPSLGDQGNASEVPTGGNVKPKPPCKGKRKKGHNCAKPKPRHPHKHKKHSHRHTNKSRRAAK